MRCWLVCVASVLFLGLTSLGCPGKSRPFPETLAALAAQEREDAEAEARVAEAQKPPPPPPPIAQRLKSLQAGLTQLQARRAKANPKQAGDRNALLKAIDKLQGQGEKLREQLEQSATDEEEDPRLDEVYEVLEVIGVMRAQLVAAKDE